VTELQSYRVAELKKGEMMEKKQVVRRFEDFEVYKISRVITKEIYLLTKENIIKKDYPLSDQMRRAAVSVMSNIAEGYERDSKKEFTHFLNIAKGSNGELRSQLSIALDLEYISKQDYDFLNDKLIKVSVMLHNLIKYLKTTQKSSTL